ncbi:MAG TPA: orotidine-5'-phosphate decarboxylase [Gemmatimonadaceae bacterium]|nr:orotidine-5'-phosphate decarboxylase [Gemmatimonadaceae bacterium]
MAAFMSTIPIIALDVPTAEDALELVAQLGDLCRFYKVGNELFTAAGPGIVRELRAQGCDVFLDLKFHDIPNTVAGGVRNAAALGARLVTVHAAGGLPMLRAAVNAAGDSCGVLAVTVLTSLAATDVAHVWGREEHDLELSDEVLRLADLGMTAGVHGVVCSGREAALVRDRFSGRLAVLVPGVRAAGGAVDDQSRVVTPEEAVAAGASYIVVGRMVTAAPDRRGAMDALLGRLNEPVTRAGEPTRPLA